MEDELDEKTVLMTKDDIDKVVGDLNGKHRHALQAMQSASS